MPIDRWIAKDRNISKKNSDLFISCSDSLLSSISTLVLVQPCSFLSCEFSIIIDRYYYKFLHSQVDVVDLLSRHQIILKGMECLIFILLWCCWHYHHHLHLLRISLIFSWSFNISILGYKVLVRILWQTWLITLLNKKV